MLFTGSRPRYFARFLGMTVASLALVGCGSSSHSSTGGGDAYVSLQWDVFDLGDTAMATPLTCGAVGAGAVVLTLQNQAGQVVSTNTFPCLDRGGVSYSVPHGAYTITLSLYGDPTYYKNSTTLLDQVSVTETLLSGANDPGLGDFFVNSFVLGWTISRGGISTTCAGAGATDVELDVYFPGQTVSTMYTFGCNDYRSATLAIPMGPYTVQWQAFLVDANGNDVASGTAMQTYNVTTSAQADLGSVIFSQ